MSRQSHVLCQGLKWPLICWAILTVCPDLPGNEVRYFARDGKTYREVRESPGGRVLSVKAVGPASGSRLATRNPSKAIDGDVSADRMASNRRLSTPASSRGAPRLNSPPSSSARPDFRNGARLVTRYQWQPRWHGRWNPFQQTHLAYHWVPVTRWESPSTPPQATEPPATRFARAPVGHGSRQPSEFRTTPSVPRSSPSSGSAYSAEATERFGGFFMDDDPPKQGRLSGQVRR